MNRWRWPALTLLAALGAALLWTCFPDYDPFVRSHVAVDREALLRQTQNFGHEFGCPVAGDGNPIVKTQNDGLLRWWRFRLQGDNEASWPGKHFQVKLRDASGEIIANFSASGKLLRFDCTPKQTVVASAAAPATLEAIRRTLAGALGRPFGEPLKTTGDRGVEHYTWPLAENPPGASWTIAADVSGNLVRHAQIDAAFADDTRQRERRESAGLRNLSISGNFVNYLFTLITPFAAIILLVRKRLNWRLTLTSAAVFAVSMLPISWLSDAVADTNAPMPPLAMRAILVLSVFVQVLLVAAGLGVGERLSHRRESRRWLGVRLLAKGDVTRRPVGTALLAALLGALAMAAIPAAVAGLPWGLPPLLSLTSRVRHAVAVGHPTLFSLMPNPSDISFPVFAVIIPAISGRRWAMPVGGVLALLLFGSVSGFETGLGAALVSATVALLIGLFIYWQFGLLAALGASVLADCLANSVRLWLSPTASIHAGGAQALAILGTVGVVSLLVHLVGRPVAEGETEVSDTPEQPEASARELLKSEFSLAHRAQQQMLPALAPVIPGFGLAGLCHPARDVGGDLYDYVRLADGRTGVCVADVSGKGMPAALYMTFTKGLLTAAAQDSGTLLEIAKQMNVHLYTAGRRKVFVTAVLGVVDQETREFEYVRAGHNPVVWWQSERRQSILLQSPGMGFGVGSSKFFDRSLKPERLQLAVGDALVFYSDGLTEAMNAELEQYGEERLMECVAQTEGLDAAQTRDTILQSVERFLNGVRAQDDMTIVVLRVETV